LCEAGVSYVDTVGSGPGAEAQAAAVPAITEPEAAEVCLAVVTTMRVCDGGCGWATCAFPAAMALFKLVGPFTGSLGDADVRRARRQKVAGTLCTIEAAVMAKAKASDATYVEKLFGLLAHGVGLPDDEHKSPCRVSEFVGRYTGILSDAVRSSSLWVTSYATDAERNGHLVEQLQQAVENQQHALDAIPGPDASATPEAKKAHREHLKGIKKALAVQRKKLEAATRARASCLQAAEDAAADHRTHFATAWAWTVLFGGALPKRAARSDDDAGGGAEAGGGAGRGDDGARSKRKNPFA
jgi:hypothetical protein